MGNANQTYTPMTDLTIFEAADFRFSLIALLLQDVPVTVDLTHVHQIDCSCLQVLLAAHRSGHLTVAGISESFRQKVMQLGCGELVGH
jgi:anti-anti-sigma regulatory factor